MAEVTRAFDEHNGRNVLRRLPNENGRQDDEQLPWIAIRDSELPPLMFQIRFRDGRVSSYAYSDIREIHCRDAGHITLCLYSMQRIAITFEGRHLRELANLLSSARLRTIDEADGRDDAWPESAPEIVNVSVETIEDVAD